MHLRITTLLALSLAACGDDTPSTTVDTTADVAAETTDDAATDDITEPDDIVEMDTNVASDAAEDTADTTVVTPISTCDAPSSARIANAAVPDGFCASIWASDVSDVRGLVVADNGDVLVIERGESRVLALWDADGDGLSGPGERAVLAEAAGLNHGIALHGGFLYASRDTTVYRWPYTAGTRTALGARETVVTGLPSGGHSTRTLTFDAEGRLYVSIGSAGNVDADSRRARIVRFDLTTVPTGGHLAADGFLFADGLRNEAGLAWDASGVLWGVQNGIDNLNRADLGGDIHQDNPAEILSRFNTEGAFHGYPYCWAEYDLPAGVGLGRNTLWAHPATMNDGTHDDAWCRANTQPAALAMQGHSAPLDLTFYDGASFPADYAGDLFVAFHGSWNRTTPTGYKVVHVDMSGDAPAEPVPFFEFDGAGDFSVGWGIRPVAVKVGKRGELFVTSDRSSQIIVIGHE